MKKFAYIVIALLSASFMTSCFEETTWEKYKDWRDVQNDWLKEELAKTDENGKPYYETVSDNFDKNAIVYMHFYNDRNATKDNLTPLYTSTIDAKYHGSFYNGTPFDSSYLSVSPADSVIRFGVSDVVSGWSIALMNMHVGDSVRVIVPYNVGYGESGRSSSSGTTIPPYTLMVFQIKLTDIPKYDIK